MKITNRMRLFIVGGIGVAFILFGLIQMVFKLDINKKIVDEVSFFLMMAAAMFMFYGRKKDKLEEEVKAEENSAGPKEEISENTAVSSDGDPEEK